MKRGSLLLVDDDRHLLESMADWLRSLGHQVDTADSFATAQRAMDRAVDQAAYDLVLLDIRLGDADGMDLLPYCRERRPETTVILITGYGTVETAVDAIRAGAFDFLTKPLIDDELEMAIQRALSQR